MRHVLRAPGGRSEVTLHHLARPVLTSVDLGKQKHGVHNWDNAGATFPAPESYPNDGDAVADLPLKNITIKDPGDASKKAFNMVVAGVGMSLSNRHVSFCC